MDTCLAMSKCLYCAYQEHLLSLTLGSAQGHGAAAAMPLPVEFSKSLIDQSPQTKVSFLRGICNL